MSSVIQRLPLESTYEPSGGGRMEHSLCAISDTTYISVNIAINIAALNVTTVGVNITCNVTIDLNISIACSDTLAVAMNNNAVA